MNRQMVHWEVGQAKALVGATICAVIKTSTSNAFGLKVELVGGGTRNVWVECDPEGNGPGHLAIEEPEVIQTAVSRPALSRA